MDRAASEHSFFKNTKKKHFLIIYEFYQTDTFYCQSIKKKHVYFKLMLGFFILNKNNNSFLFKNEKNPFSHLCIYDPWC